MKLHEILPALQAIAPLQYAEPWDNVGLLAGDPQQDITRAILTIDYTPAVADEARRENCDLVISYHPPIFDPLKRLIAGHPVFDAIRRGVAIYSPHTALDAADGGTHDMLADALGLGERSPLRTAPAAPTHYKLVTFVPAAAVDSVSRALFDAGAGRIGDYSSCSFRVSGVGTFFGSETTHPAVGQKGRLERVDEIRLETLLPIDRAAAVVAALRAAHPYESPAFDLNVLASVASPMGQGRIGSLPPTPRLALIDHVKRVLDLKTVLVAGPTTGSVSRAAVCAGACGKLLDDAIAAKADLYLTGEMRHHDALRAADAGLTVVCLLHSNSERAVLKRVQDRLAELAPQLPTLLSLQDRDPFSVA
jgi:dinuclear metal center YbgI/SA1388 family protein